MVKFKQKNILGTFILDNQYNVLFEGAKAEEFTTNVTEPDISKAILPFKNRQYFKDFRQKNIELTKSQVKSSVSDDQLIIQSSSAIDDTKKSINTLAKRLREWYGLYLPELKTEDHHHFTDLVLEKSKKDILAYLKKTDSMGADLDKSDLTPIFDLAKQISSLFQFISFQETYLQTLMERHCRNVATIATPLVGAKLLHQAGSLKHLSEFPSSTIQLLGAEEALFRHLKTGANSPKYGFLHEHPLVLKSKASMRGKVARAVADKIAIAAKVDYFKGEYIADKIKDKLEKRFG
jgi:nucleolar protein 56